MSAYRRPGYTESRKRPTLLLAGAIAALALIIAIPALIFGGGGTGAPTPTPEPTPSVEPTIEPTAEPTIEPTPAPPQDYAVATPKPAQPGFLPVLRKGDTSEKIIAITVDDCSQFTNTRKIIDIALAAGGKITLFPIGKNVMQEKLQDTIRYAYDSGMEIENHSYSHIQLCAVNDAVMANEIYYQDNAIDYVLNLDYRARFFRPYGGDGRHDQRTHLYLKQIGYLGVAHWSVSGSGTNVDKLLRDIEPGNVYLFHTTDSDLAKLEQFIPGAVAAGYKLVTLNEMFGYPENEAYPLSAPVTSRETPQIKPYTLEYVTLENGDMVYLVYLLQARLKELDYLSTAPDGVYGNQTENAVKEFQKRNGLPVTGAADAATQQALYSDTAKRASE